MSIALSDRDLPGFWRDADAASFRGQRWSIRYARMRLLGSIVAAFGGAILWKDGSPNPAAIIIVVGFVAALVSEVLAWSHQPEILWYEGRAVAESVKTLSWRYAVGAEPFPAKMPATRARELLRSRLRDVSRESGDGITMASDAPIATQAMDLLREQPFAARRDAYIAGRTIEQQHWYAAKATFNHKAVTAWRIALVTAEIVAVVLASLRVFGNWEVDFAGILAALIASGAAWVALKQYAP